MIFAVLVRVRDTDACSTFNVQRQRRLIHILNAFSCRIGALLSEAASRAGYVVVGFEEK